MDWLTWGDVLKLATLGFVAVLLWFAAMFPLTMFVIADTNNLKAQWALSRQRRRAE